MVFRLTPASAKKLCEYKLHADGQVGRIVIGQIHARNDQPIRLYDRKLPQNKFGSI